MGTNGTIIISKSINSVDVPRTVDEVDITTFGAGDFRQFLAGFQGATIRVAGFFDDLASPALGTTNDGGADQAFTDWLSKGTQLRKFIFSPSGTATGKIQYQGTCLILGYSLNGAIGNAVSFNTDMRVTGSISRFSW